MSGPQVLLLGDSCMSVRFGEVIDPAVNARSVALARALEALRLAGVRDVVPTYSAVTVHFDPRVADRQALAERARVLAMVVTPDAGETGRTVEVPVTYGGEAGPDLSDVAAFARCTEADVVRMHAGRTYRVFMLGFLPGFAYLGRVDARIAMPRLDTPRLRVAAGSVGIAGEQTGIYPFDSPGGWRIIGRTPRSLFDVRRDEPFLLKAGDHVRFVAA